MLLCHSTGGGAVSGFRWQSCETVDQIHKCCRDVRVDMFSLVFRCLMPLWRHASNEYVEMVGDFLEDF